MDGDRLARATFSVIVKFSEQVQIFQDLWDNVEEKGIEIDGDKKNPANLNRLADMVKEEKAEELDIMCAQWE